MHKSNQAFVFLLNDFYCLLILFLIRCFPHIVNLAVKAVLAVMTDLQYANPNASDYQPAENCSRRDPIAILRTLIRIVRIFLLY